jgi:hypothetical protein
VLWLQKGISDMIIKEKAYEYKLTLDELAQEIWNLDDTEQCKLLDKLYNIDESFAIEMQMEYLSDKLKENEYAMKIIDGLYERVHSIN